MSTIVEPVLQQAQLVWERLENAFHDAAECFLSDTLDEDMHTHAPGVDQLLAMSIVFKPAHYVINQQRWPSENQMLEWRQQFVTDRVSSTDANDEMVNFILQRV